MNDEFDMDKIREISIARHMPSYGDVVDVYRYSSHKTTRKVRRPVLKRNNNHKTAIAAGAATFAFIAAVTLGVNIGKGNNTPNPAADSPVPIVQVDNDYNNTFRPDNLVFEHDVREVDGPGVYKVVVNKDGKCSFVDINYNNPTQFLNEVFCKDAAKYYGFDFNSLNSLNETSESVENDDYDNLFKPDNLVFEHDVREVNGPGVYKVVVNKDGKCSFVDSNYNNPTQFLNEVFCEDAAEYYGFDFNSLNSSKIR